MKKILILLALFIGLGARASNFFGGDIPTGDTINGQTVMTLVNGDNTLATNSGNGGYFQGYTWHIAGATAGITATKITVDGGSEKTLGTLTQLSSAGGTDYLSGYTPVGIKFRTSIVIKVTKASVAGTTVKVCPIYNINP